MKNESGRSMIEMLGVLAIIGVLSVGGIAGYSKAMEKFKINKTINQISHIIANTHTLFMGQSNYKGLNLSTAHSVGIITDEIWNYETDAAYNVWGGEININSANAKRDDGDVGMGFLDDSVDFEAIWIAYYNVPRDACISLLSHDWSNAGDYIMYSAGDSEGMGDEISWMVWVVPVHDCKVVEGQQSYPYQCKGEGNMNPSETATVCSGSTNHIAWKFR